MRSILATLVLLTSLAAPATAAVRFEADLNGALAGTPSGATGTAVLILNDDATEVGYEIVYSGLVGVEGAAHFHNAPPGRAGPLLFDLPLGSPKTGVWPVTPEIAVELHAGRVYVNIPTDIYATGEIRGDVAFVAVPSRPVTWSGLKARYR